jgi:phosphate transport system substrate-binding protein
METNVKTQLARTSLLFGALAMSALAIGCKKKTEETKGGEGSAVTAPDGSGKEPAPSGKAALNGSGSTFQKAYQEEAIVAFTKANPNVTINYGGGGSGKGRQDLADQVVELAGSDSAYKDADLAKNKGGEILYFPILLGPITVSYNLDGVESLQLSPETVAKIFQRDIKKWDDAAIAADNPGVKLPATDIVVAHRSDGSGTTDNFTKYLDQTVGAAGGGTVWKLKSGSTVEWPADTQAGQGNAGVAQIVKATAGAVGYVDLSDAKASGLRFAAIKNQAGKFVAPTAEASSSAADGIEIKDNLLFSALNAKGDTAYPITYQSWVIVYAKQTDAAKGAALKAYLKYLLTDGQALLPGLDFAPLPKSLQEKALAQLDKIQLP